MISILYKNDLKKLIAIYLPLNFALPMTGPTAKPKQKYSRDRSAKSAKQAKKA